MGRSTRPVSYRESSSESEPPAISTVKREVDDDGEWTIDRTETTTVSTSTKKRRATRIKTEATTVISPSRARVKSEPQTPEGITPRRTPRRSTPRSTTLSDAVVKPGDVDIEDLPIRPPEDWEEVYELLRTQRRNGPLAPVDTMGCDAHVLAQQDPKVGRLHNLVSLVLSSQTKDTINAIAMTKLKTHLPGGLTVQSLLDCPAEELNKLIYPVGFHNRKTIYLNQIAQILRDDYEDDIPRTLEGLLALPGVGPKMAYLCLNSTGDGTAHGIGVDVHVHRIANMFNWTSSPPHTYKTHTPEKTRLALESWLPRDRWGEINHLLVGLGQTVCLPRGRRCWECLLGKQAKCPAALEGAHLGQPPPGYRGRKTPVKSSDPDPHNDSPQQQHPLEQLEAIKQELEDEEAAELSVRSPYFK
ncbi:alpha,alpha-trehalase nth1 [Savitreella phatthalungensis]